MLDNAYTYNDDGTFLTVNRFKNGDSEWQEQSVSGTWSAAPGDEAQTCTLEMASTFENDGFTGSSSSSSTVVYIDADTFRSMDFDMHRVAAD